MNIYQKQLSEFSRDYYAGASTGILVSSCLGAIAAMLILMNGHEIAEMIQLGLVVVVCMWFNASVLAQLKSKFVFNSLIISLLVSITFILINIL
ncbi:hypothetical protein C8P64_3145 [Christiangramia gaetbulicola]|uniref:Uncharacterized protein n=1 Tax=Christiangramia gaetbulicola TaxID=703340 RepID=A0A2T6ACY5_9FLAO|nr:hypothetical protein [Christiangramia gaetbulicola]PTX41646.1 hypothetical protein C8P64_3145 [Christiangramia gaetbulicola]